MFPSVSIIILNWNGWEDTLECLESLYQINYSNYEIILVDNGSDDGSITKIREYCNGDLKVDSSFLKDERVNKSLKLFEYKEDDSVDLSIFKEAYDNLRATDKLILLKNTENYGYAKGNNIGIEFALKYLKSDYVLILNNDTVVDKNFLNEMVKIAESDVKVGCVGPKVYYYNYKGRTDVISFAGEKISLYTSRGKRFGLNQIDRGQFDKVSETDKVEGCCMLLKRGVVEKGGMFDPVYFAYWEETDLCLRMKNEGYTLLYVPEAHVWHKVGVTWDNYFSYFVIYHYLVRNRLIFIWRYASGPEKLFFSLFFTVYLAANMILMIIKNKWKNSKEGFRAVKNGIKDFRSYKNKL